MNATIASYNERIDIIVSTEVIVIVIYATR